ncbi:hypothetical protein [Streptomyces aculeolatus]|uniref:hypothetical protein n=1 Tax=Streptomyces aculeolatus TaxID=270689 RepID=UPI001CECEB5E|nr:hypothetical protein [Streptomyces aculeolatus]
MTKSGGVFAAAAFIDQAVGSYSAHIVSVGGEIVLRNMPGKGKFLRALGAYEIDGDAARNAEVLFLRCGDELAEFRVAESYAVL